jgi:hypothetical protein
MHQSMSVTGIVVYIACLIAILCGCEEKRLESTEIISPGKDLVLRIEIDKTGAAAVPFLTSAFVFPSKSSAFTWKKRIFKGSAMSNFRADWGKQDEIHISYTAGYVSLCDPGPVNLASKNVRIVGCK